jgi:hypothetical protein
MCPLNRFRLSRRWPSYSVGLSPHSRWNSLGIASSNRESWQLAQRSTISCPASPCELERCGRRTCRSAGTERSQDRIEHQIQVPVHNLPQGSATPSIRSPAVTGPCACRAGRRPDRRDPGTVQLHGHACVGAQEIDFQCPEAIEGDRQRNVQPEAPLGLR